MSSDRKLRIVHCFRSPVGGIFRHVRDLTAAQVAAGHQVGIVCDSSTGGTYEAQLFDAMRDQLGLGLQRVPMQRHIGLADMTTGFRIFSAIKGMQPDILHGHGAKGGVYARVFGSLLRLAGSRPARLYSPHGGSLHYDRNRASGRLIFAIERFLERLNDHLLFVSDYERQAYHNKIGRPRCSESVVYNGLRPDEFMPVLPRENASDFLYIGMMRDLKGPDIFLDGLADASERTCEPISAVMVGDGADRDKYVAQSKRLGLNGHVTFRDPMPTRDALALARTVVVPSRAEAMPYVVLEALAAGKPVIASAVGGIPEVFGASSPALIQPDKSQLAGKMIDALQPREQNLLPMPDMADLKARFGVDVMATQVERAYFGALVR